MTSRFTMMRNELGTGRRMGLSRTGNLADMRNGLLAGVAAGVAGTTALNIVTYLDMVARGRPPSSTPERSVETLSARVGVTVPGERNARSNRIHGLAGLLELSTGVAIGVVLAGLDKLLGGPAARLPVPLSGCLFGGIALVGANGPMALLGITDPREWTATEWASDVVPHVAYGWTAAYVYRLASR